MLDPVEQVDDLTDFTRDGDLDGDLQEIAALHGRQDALRPGLGARRRRHLLRDILQLRRGDRGSGRDEKPRGEALDALIDRLQLRGDRRFAADELPPPRDDVRAYRQELRRALVAGANRLDDEQPTADREREQDGARHDVALARGQAREHPHHRGPGRPGAGTGDWVVAGGAPPLPLVVGGVGVGCRWTAGVAAALRGGSAARC